MALGPVIDFLMRLTSFVGACLAMTAVFLIMPNTRVRVISALIGGIVGGALWQTALILHVNFQRGVAQYNALYSGFAALPIFLVWIYVSWLAVLVGGEVAASHQNDQTARQRLRARQVDEAFKEKLAVAVMGRVARAFLDAAPRPSTEQLVCELQAPPQTIDEVAGRLIDHGLLVASGRGPERTFVPGRDLDSVRIHELVRVLRHCHPPDQHPGEELAGPPAINGLMQALDDVVARSEANLTLRQLAELVPADADGARTPAPGPDRPVRQNRERVPPAGAAPHRA
jgi:membrane protein